MSRERYSLWEDLVARTSKFVSKDFPEVEYEELFQDLMLFVLATPRLESPDNSGMPTALYRKAVAVCWEYRKQGLTLSAQYAYRTSDVKRILETLFDHSKWDGSYLPEDMQGEEVFDDKIVAHSDVRVAYDKLSKPLRKNLFLRYALQEEVSEDKIRYALERICDVLNFYRGDPTIYEGPGSRRVMSNAEARYTIDNERDGGNIEWT